MLGIKQSNNKVSDYDDLDIQILFLFSYKKVIIYTILLPLVNYVTYPLLFGYYINNN